MFLRRVGIPYLARQVAMDVTGVRRIKVYGKLFEPMHPIKKNNNALFVEAFMEQTSSKLYRGFSFTLLIFLLLCSSTSVNSPTQIQCCLKPPLARFIPLP